MARGRRPPGTSAAPKTATAPHRARPGPWMRVAPAARPAPAVARSTESTESQAFAQIGVPEREDVGNGTRSPPHCTAPAVSGPRRTSFHCSLTPSHDRPAAPRLPAVARVPLAAAIRRRRSCRGPALRHGAPVAARSAAGPAGPARAGTQCALLGGGLRRRRRSSAPAPPAPPPPAVPTLRACGAVDLDEAEIADRFASVEALRNRRAQAVAAQGREWPEGDGDPGQRT